MRDLQLISIRLKKFKRCNCGEIYSARALRPAKNKYRKRCSRSLLRPNIKELVTNRIPGYDALASEKRKCFFKRDSGAVYEPRQNTIGKAR